MADYAGAKAAIAARLEANWTLTRITRENTNPGSPWPPRNPDGDLGPFVHLVVMNAGSEAHAFAKPGSHTWRYDGVIMVHVSVPSGSGDELAVQYATQIGEIFRARKFYDDVTPGCFVRTGSPAVDDRGERDGDWFRVSAMIDFQYFHRG